MLFSLTLLMPILVAVIYVENTVAHSVLRLRLRWPRGFSVASETRGIELRTAKGFFGDRALLPGAWIIWCLPLSPLLGSGITEILPMLRSSLFRELRRPAPPF
ncbi:MAG: hypothetical protein CM1200mP9_00100 [Gammaproteobacteria bacterium]|nr:MAG: hypothetical protein CM1200mP9_00100 [Gammaproteobacteria bacterium]